MKEAEASVLEEHLGPSQFKNHGQRVVTGQRLMQATSDIFLGWVHVESPLDGQRRDFYRRQLKDWKRSAEIEQMLPQAMSVYGKLCGWTLARAHAPATASRSPPTSATAPASTARSFSSPAPTPPERTRLPATRRNCKSGRIVPQAEL